MERSDFDIVIIGAGILGTNLAYLFSSFSEYSVLLIEREHEPALHSSSRNTGVIHRPFYLDPLKKRVFARAAQFSYPLWKEFSVKYNLPWNQNGTIEVAVRESDTDTLQKYEQYAVANGMEKGEFSLLSNDEVRGLEPLVKSNGAFYSKTDTGVSFGLYARKLLEMSVARGASVKFDTFVDKVLPEESKLILSGRDGRRSTVRYRALVNVAGSGAVGLARKFGLARQYAVLHFRGDYWRVSDSFRGRIRRNIYSVPRHSKFPFLDPHFVIRHDGKMELGPNAALVWGPYGYLRGDPNRRISDIDLLARPVLPKLKLFTNMEFLSMVRQEWKSSTHRDAMIGRISQFVEGLSPDEITGRGLSGIRHNLIDSGGFVPEAVIEIGDSSLHVMNYNSPGATGAPAYSAHLMNRMVDAGLISGKKINTGGDGDMLWGSSFAMLLENMA